MNENRPALVQAAEGFGPGTASRGLSLGREPGKQAGYRGLGCGQVLLATPQDGSEVCQLGVQRQFLPLGTLRTYAPLAGRMSTRPSAASKREISIVPRDNANGARAKSGGRTVPAGAGLIRLYADYLHEEYGGIDSGHVFVNIWAEPKGHAWSYQGAYDLVLRLRARTGIAFDPHWFRHSAATS